MSKISIQEVKEALRDSKFRLSLPPELKEDVRKYEQNPNCPCNIDVYRNIIKLGAKQLREYYPGNEVITEAELSPVRQNNFVVINCGVEEIEEKLKPFKFGDWQIAIARWEDKATLIINDVTQIV